VKLPDRRLFSAIRNRDLDAVRKAIDSGADVNAQDERGNTPLHAVSWYGGSDIAQLLLDHGADIEKKSVNGDTPLIEACWGGSLSVVCLLIEKGAEMEARGKVSHTPLHVACHNGHFDIAKFLLEKGADVNARDDEGRVALSYVLGLPPGTSLSASREKLIDLFREYAPEMVMEVWCTDNTSQHTGMGL